MTAFLLILASFLAIALWYALAGRRWLKSKPWAQGFFTAIEPIEIALFKKSETILAGRLLWFGGLLTTAYDGLAVFASGLDLTPVTTRVFDATHIPPDMRGLVVTALVGALGLLMNWLRKRTSKPLEVVAVADKDVTPAVQQALDVADIAKDQAVAAVADAKAA